MKLGSSSYHCKINRFPANLVNLTFIFFCNKWLCNSFWRFIPLATYFANNPTFVILRSLWLDCHYTWLTTRIFAKCLRTCCFTKNCNGYGPKYGCLRNLGSFHRNKSHLQLLYMVMTSINPKEFKYALVFSCATQRWDSVALKSKDDCSHGPRVQRHYPLLPRAVAWRYYPWILFTRIRIQFSLKAVCNLQSLFLQRQIHFCLRYVTAG